MAGTGSNIMHTQVQKLSSRYHPYPEYSNSGIDNIGQIPKHWITGKLKHVASIHFSNVDKHTNKDEIPIELCNYTDVYYHDIIIRDTKFMKATATSTEIDRYTLHEGDVLITKDSESWDDIAVSAYVSEDMKGVLCGYHLAHIRPEHDRVSGRFLSYAFSTLGISDQFKIASTGITRYGLGKQWLDNGIFTLPPVKEQHTIAFFLDRETSRIDALIEKKERLLELLQEKRASLVTATVTRGLDPNVQMKDSGVEWLGDVPEHWQVKRLWHLSEYNRPIMYGIVLPGPNVDDGVPIIKGGDVRPERLDSSRLSRTTFEIESSHARSRLADGDLVYAIRGSIGDVEMIPLELEGANLTQDAARISYTSDTNGSWLLFTLKSSVVYQQLEAGTVGATIRGINIRDLKRAVIPAPPKNEQADIALHLESKIAVIKHLERGINDSIQLLSEYRTALITAAVTGKIDVREEVA